MSRLHPFKGLSALFVILCLVGCEAAKSANPTAPSVAGPIPGVNITTPRALEPFAGSTLTFNNEPPTLLIENPGTSGTRSIWLQVEVGVDAGFQQIVHQADQIALGTNGIVNDDHGLARLARMLDRGPNAIKGISICHAAAISIALTDRGFKRGQLCVVLTFLAL